MLGLSFKPELHGERFANHEVPLELLKDFAAFEEMLIEVAKQEYLNDNPGRFRIPRGFTKGVEVRLAGIEPGSAKLLLALAGLLVGPETAYLAKAHDKIVDAIENIGHGRASELPPALLRYFDRFGRSLREGERISFPRSDGGETNLTPEVREKLLRASEAEEWTEEALLKGRVSAWNKATGDFTLQLTSGAKLEAPAEEQHKSTLLQAFTEYENKRMLAVRGVLRRYKNGIPKSIDSIEHVTLLDLQDIETRLDQLATLKDRWLNGKGVSGLKALSESFERNFASDLPLPYLYPTPEGGVLAEWEMGRWAVSLEIEIPGQRAQYQALNLDSDDSSDFDLDLSKPDQWEGLNNALRNLVSR